MGFSSTTMNYPRPDQIPPFPGAEIHPHLRSAHHQEMMAKFDPIGEQAVMWQVEYDGDYGRRRVVVLDRSQMNSSVRVCIRGHAGTPSRASRGHSAHVALVLSTRIVVTSRPDAEGCEEACTTGGWMP